MKNFFKIACFIAGVLILMALLGIPFRGGYWSARGYVADRDARIEGKGIRKYFKGYVVNESVVPCDREVPYMDPNEKDAFEIPKDQRRDFEKIYDLCRREGIRLVLYAVPSPHCYSTSMHNGYVKFAEEYGLPFLDGNWDIEKIGIDMTHDYFDKGGDHLNLFGTRKMTEYLAQYLESECDLTDHRTDPAYKSWDDLLPAYEQEIIDMEGTGYPILEGKIKERRRKEKNDPEGKKDR